MWNALEFTWNLWANPMENMGSIEEASRFHWESINSILNPYGDMESIRFFMKTMRNS